MGRAFSKRRSYQVRRVFHSIMRTTSRDSLDIVVPPLYITIKLQKRTMKHISMAPLRCGSIWHTRISSFDRCSEPFVHFAKSNKRPLQGLLILDEKSREVKGRALRLDDNRLKEDTKIRKDIERFGRSLSVFC